MNMISERTFLTLVNPKVINAVHIVIIVGELVRADVRLGIYQLQEILVALLAHVVVRDAEEELGSPSCP